MFGKFIIVGEKWSSNIFGDQNYRRIGRRDYIFEYAHRGARTVWCQNNPRLGEIIKRKSWMDSSRISGDQRAELIFLCLTKRQSARKIGLIESTNSFRHLVQRSTNFQQIFVSLAKNNLTNFANKRQLRSSLMDSCINEIVQSSFVSQISSICAFTVEIIEPFFHTRIISDRDRKIERCGNKYLE